MPGIDPAFAALPLRDLADAALDRAARLGASDVAFRCERVASQTLRLRDGVLQSVADTAETGLCVRVVKDGTWGFAASTDVIACSAAWAAEQAMTIAEIAAALNRERIELAAEPEHGEQTWVSAYQVDPFSVPVDEKIAMLAQWSRRLLAAGVTHVDAELHQVRENKFYADARGTAITQQRIRLHPLLNASIVDGDSFEEMRTLAPPVGRGYEYLTGDGWDWDSELAALPGLLAEKLAAPSVAPGRYDLVIDPTNLWLVIHESVGHPTELDRALGYETAYAGTSFATPDKLGSLQYGSAIMHVTGDRTAPHGLATTGYDDEGVASQSWDLIADGVLTGYQLDRRTAALAGCTRSNGCAFAGSPSSMPLQRMPNVSLRPAAGGPSTDGLIAGVERGIYVVGDRSWSIDMQRYNFQFTGQRFYKIEHGRLAGQLRNVAYQATTTDFWNGMEAIGGPETYLLGGAFNCGKGQPGQLAPVSHGSPTAVFRGVNVINAAAEAGQ